MKWEGREQSENVEDRRGVGLRGGMAVGGGGLVIMLVAYFFGVDPNMIAQLLGPQAGQQQIEQPIDPAEAKLADFTKTIFRDTEIVWDELFRKAGKQYDKPRLVLFSGRVESACGLASAAVGPFYCPGDTPGKVYIDLKFYRSMAQDLKAPGEFARAYVVAHEVGHHVQRLTGYSARVDQARRTKNELEANHASVRLELQADYLAGVWAHHAQKKFNFLEKGDVESALNAAFRIGDDTLQMEAKGYVVPEKFNHGTSKQRMRWFREGLDTGDFDSMRQLFELPYNKL